MKKPYDLAVILGTRFDEHERLRQDLIDRLDRATELYKQGVIKKIMVSGKWSIWYDWLSITPQTTEANLMKQYLLDHEVRARDVIMETYSKDTIGNIYYLRRYLDSHPQYNNILIVCASQRALRVKFLVSHILPATLTVSYCLVDAPNDEASSLGSEQQILNEQRYLFKQQSFDINTFLSSSLYQNPYYTNQAKQVESGERRNELVD